MVVLNVVITIIVALGDRRRDQPSITVLISPASRIISHLYHRVNAALTDNITTLLHSTPIDGVAKVIVRCM